MADEDDKQPPQLAPSGVADPAVLRSIDEEFADLTREIERITSLAHAGPEDRDAMLKTLQALREQWNKRLAERSDRPQWQQRVDLALSEAFEKVIAEGQGIDPEGNSNFHLSGDLLKKHGAPVVNALLDGLQQQFLEKWAPKPTAAKPAPGAPASPPAGPPQFDAADLAGIFITLFRDKLTPKK